MPASWPAGWHQSGLAGWAAGLKVDRAEPHAEARHAAALATPKGSSKPAGTPSIQLATKATAAAGGPPRHPEPDATAPGGGEKTPPTRAQGCGTAALAQPLRRMTRSKPAAGCELLDWSGRQALDRFSGWGAEPGVPKRQRLSPVIAVTESWT
jgi:hypothetical protein